MFVQSPLMPTFSNTMTANDIRTVSNLALNNKLNEVLSSINGEDEQREASVASNIAAQTASFSQVMASFKDMDESERTSSEKTALLPFSSSLNGDYLSSFKIENPTPSDRVAEPQGMAARGLFREYSPEGEERMHTIDKTSVLYEKALEMESYFVKIMMQSMRATLSGQTLIGEESFASKMYKDMMYDELNRTVTKNAGFGLADHIYLQLNRENSNN